MLPCTLGLRLSQIVGRERGGIARLARRNSFHRGQRHAGCPLLAQMLRKKPKRQIFVHMIIRESASPEVQYGESCTEP